MKRYICKYGRAAMYMGIMVTLLILSPLKLNAQDNLGKGRIRGNIFDAEKRPLPGVKIVAQSLAALTTILNAETNDKGAFSILGLGTGMWRFVASKSGYHDEFKDVEVRQLRPNPPLIFEMKNISTVSEGDNSQKEPSDALDKGNMLLAQEKYEEARIIFEKFLSQYSKSYQVRLQIGLCWLKQGELDKAETELKFILDKVLETSGAYEKDAATSMQALAGLGELAIKRNDIEAGLKLFRQALEISPTNEILAYNMAEILFANQKTDEAIQYYLLAIQIKKDWPKPYNKLGMAYLNKGDFTKALEALRQFVALDPNSQAAAEARNIIAALEKMK